jgi:uncharacterized protein
VVSGQLLVVTGKDDIIEIDHEEAAMKLGNLEFAREAIEAFCKKWKIDEFSVFGSALREDFRPESDVDVLISLAPGEEMTLESYMEMREELSAIFGGREIDLVQKRLLKNRFRRAHILENREIVYAA